LKLTEYIEAQPPTAVWQKWLFSAPQTHLWLIKHWFSASIFAVKIAPFAKWQTVSGQLKERKDALTTT